MRMQVSVMPEDVTFPVDEFGEANRVQVNVYRDHRAREPVSMLIARYFGIETADISATQRRRPSKATRHDLREAVHDSRQVARDSESAVGRRRHLMTPSTIRVTRCSNPDVYIPRGSDRLYRLQPGDQPRAAPGAPCRHGHEHHRQLLFLAGDSATVTGGDE